MCCVQATERRGLQNENDRFLQQQTYKLISGHRRLSAIKLLSEKGKWNSGTVPCYVITAKKSEAEMNLDLIMLNHTQRKYSDADIFKEHEELKKIFTQLEADGVEIKGRLREKIAKAMHVSSAQIGKIENIKNKMFINEQLFRNNSERTLIWYNENLSAFFNWLGENKNVDSLTVDNYKLYCTFLQHDYVKCNGQPLKSSSVNSRVRAVKAFYNYCIEEDLLPNFSKKLKATKIRKSEKFPLDDDEIHTLISAFGDSELEERNRCWVILMCDSGLRRGEIINLQIGNVHLERGFMIVTGKGDKQRLSYVSETALHHDVVGIEILPSSSKLISIDPSSRPSLIAFCISINILSAEVPPTELKLTLSGILTLLVSISTFVTGWIGSFSDPSKSSSQSVYNLTAS